MCDSCVLMCDSDFVNAQARNRALLVSCVMCRRVLATGATTRVTSLFI